jgi:hypothetical protein
MVSAGKSRIKSRKKKVTKKSKADKEEERQVNMRNAVEFRKNNEKVSIRKVADQFNVSKSALHRFIENPQKIGRGRGMLPVLGMEYENELKEWIFEMVNRGFSVNKIMVLQKANAMIKKIKQDDGASLSNGWYVNFRERHPDLVLRVQDHLSKIRKNGEAPEKIRHFFTILQDLIIENRLLPNDIYNCDETGMVRNTSSKYTLAKRGTKKVNITTCESRKLSTLLVCGNAAGERIPAFFVHSGMSFKLDHFSIPSDCMVGVTETAYMNTKLFNDWFKNMFMKHIGSSRPKMLILDSHKSHIDYELAQTAKDNGIILLALPPHTSHIFQPLDVAVFKPLKGVYKKLASEWLLNNTEKEIPLKDFVNMFYQAFDKSVTSKNLIAGFVGSCIFPCRLEVALKKVEKSSCESISSLLESQVQEILTFPPNEIIDPTIEKTTVRFEHNLTRSEFIESAKKKEQEKKSQEEEKEKRKKERSEKKEEKQKKTTESSMLREQKKKGIFCKCHKACSTNKKCPCKALDRHCTIYCGCKKKCTNVSPIISSPNVTSSHLFSRCCVKSCSAIIETLDLTQCDHCQNPCHRTTCTMPQPKASSSTDLSLTLCNDCGEKEY